MRYIRDEIGEAALGVYHGPKDTATDTRRPVILLDADDPADNSVVEIKHRIPSIHIGVRNYRGALGRLWRSAGGSKAG